MAENNVQAHLQKSQYQNSANLDARIQIHLRFKTNPYDWFRWVYDRLPMEGQLKILELGCGHGNLWLNNLDRIPDECKLFLTDFSAGMVRAATENLSLIKDKVFFQIVDAQAIPFPDEFFDIVIANHMLYHVQNRQIALENIFRILKQTGKFFAATVGLEHMEEIFTLGSRLVPTLKEQSEKFFSMKNFTLENGSHQLLSQFSTVKIDVFPDSLEVTDTDSFVAYIFSIVDKGTTDVTDSQISTFKEYLQKKIDKQGCIPVKKATGLFIAEK